MSRPLPKNLVASRELRARRNRIRTDYIRNLREESENEINESAEPLKVPKFTIPEIPKIEKLQATYTSPVVEKQNNTLDDFEREYQAFIEKLKKEKEKKELKEELKAFCKDYINELLGINQPQEEPEPKVEEPEDTAKPPRLTNVSQLCRADSTRIFRSYSAAAWLAAVQSPSGARAASNFFSAAI